MPFRPFSFIADYKKIALPVRNAIAAEFFIQAVNATFMNILPLYMARKGYAEEDIAMYITFRFIGVFLLAIPLGRLIRGRKLLPLFYVSNVFVCLFGLAIVFFIGEGWHLASKASLLLWGASFTFMQIPIFPFILRNSPKTDHTAAISLSYSTWSFGGIASGLLIALLDSMNSRLFDEKAVLVLFCVFGLGGLFFLARTKGYREVFIADNAERQLERRRRPDWSLVLRALTPTLIIAVGAGLTIPFISLFFEKVHGVHKGGFSVLSFSAAMLVAYGAMLVPKIKVRLGYARAIPLSQSLAVLFLILLATTEIYREHPASLAVAALCYLLRQPLMNMAGPMTSELVLSYVGRKNREITSALTSAIWSGSWVFSGLMVSVLFSAGLSFSAIFLLTSLLYGFGTMLYALLIKDQTRREAKGLTEL